MEQPENYYGYVYLIYDQKNKKVYIGQTIRRVEESYFGSGTWIKRIIKKRGTYFLKKRILGFCYSNEELLECETECKLFYNSLNPIYGYNIIKKDCDLRDAISNHPDKELIYKKRTETRMSWYKHSEETKQKLSVSHDGIGHTEETKQKLSIKGKGRDAWNKGLTKETNESVKKISESRKGIIFTEEHKKNLSISLKGKESPMKGRKHKESSKNQMSVSKTGKPIFKLRGRTLSEETKYKCGNGNRGRKQEKEEIEKRAFANTKLKSKQDLYAIIDMYFNRIATSEIANFFKVNSATIRKKLKILTLPTFVNENQKYKWLDKNNREDYYKIADIHGY